MGLENRILVQVVGRNGKQIIEGGVEVDAEDEERVDESSRELPL